MPYLHAFTHEDGTIFEIDGASIYVEEQGNPTGQPLVFLHGGMGTIEDFNGLLPSLGENYRLIGIDTRGQGKSTLGNPALTYSQLERDVTAIVEALGLHDIIMIGDSDGGITALRLAAAKHIHIKKLISVGAHWNLADNDPCRKMYEALSADDWRAMFPEGVALYERINPQPDCERLIEALKGLWLNSSVDGYPKERVRNIETPLLIVRGDDDELVSRSNAVELADRVKNAKLLNLPFAGHVAHEDQPKTFLWAVHQFLA